jgi:Flp pilus assembly protein TadD
MRRLLLSRVAVIALVGVWAASCSTMDSLTPGKQAAAKPAAQTPSTEDIAALAKADAPTLAANIDTGVQKAKQQRAAGDLNGSAHTLSQLMLVAPDDPRVVSEYGKVMVGRGRSDDAIAFLKRALELSPDDWTLYSAIGIAYDQKSEFADSKLAYDRALQLKPGDPSILNNYAMSRMLAGDLSDAQRLIAEANASGSADPKIAHNVELMASLVKGANPAPTSAAPVAAAPAPASKAPVTVQTASGPVMMQAIPKDTGAPKATQAPKALAVKAAPADQTPSLRTAAD